MPKVFNKYQGNVPKGAKYIGRGSPYGNKFRIGDMWKGKPMTRDDVCDRFRCEQLPGMDVSALRGQDLLCFCKPKRCHGDSILRKANRGRS